MECPNCKYNPNEKHLPPMNDEGDFYELPIKMEREESWEPVQRENVHGCPKCGILFINV